MYFALYQLLNLIGIDFIEITVYSMPTFKYACAQFDLYLFSYTHAITKVNCNKIDLKSVASKA